MRNEDARKRGSSLLAICMRVWQITPWIFFSRVSAPDSHHNELVGHVNSHVVARPTNAVVPLGHEQVPGPDARQLGDCLIVCLARRTPRSAKIKLMHLRGAPQTPMVRAYFKADCCLH
jgi:hypothetical protein